MKRIIKLDDFEIGSNVLTIMAGPCAIESKDILFKTADFLKQLCDKENINFIFKSSYDKANRSSLSSYRGLGVEKGLELLKEVKEQFNVPIVTDVHQVCEVEQASKVADILQIPAFLCRQTDLIVECAKSGKIVNIKKGQFLCASQMESIAKKALDSGNDNIIITERGTSFGYNNLVVDFRSVDIIHEMGFPFIFDATHSVQLPGLCGTSSSGDRRFVPTLSKAAVASGFDGLFFEIHPDPDKALCDGSNMINFETAEVLFGQLNELFKLVKRQTSDAK